jgi:hypothetical protein
LNAGIVPFAFCLFLRFVRPDRVPQFSYLVCLYFKVLVPYGISIFRAWRANGIRLGEVLALTVFSATSCPAFFSDAKDGKHGIGLLATQGYRYLGTALFSQVRTATDTDIDVRRVL